MSQVFREEFFDLAFFLLKAIVTSCKNHISMVNLLLEIFNPLFFSPNFKASLLVISAHFSFLQPMEDISFSHFISTLFPGTWIHQQLIEKNQSILNKVKKEYMMQIVQKFIFVSDLQTSSKVTWHQELQIWVQKVRMTKCLDKVCE